jgi:peptidoglycan/xylan/chitin deacetylase (PgdA/CDA1 family)
MATRSAASGGYESIPGTLLENFSTLADWTKNAFGTIEADAVNSLEGAASLKLNAGAGETVTATKTIALDMSKFDGIELNVYIPDTTYLSYVGMRIGNNAGMTEYHDWSQDAYNGIYLYKGWNKLVLTKSMFSSDSGVWTSKIRLQVKIIAGAGGAASVSFDAIVTGRRTRAKFIFTFDGMFDGVYTDAFPIMEKRGFKGVAFAHIAGLDVSPWMSTVRLQALHDAGWDIGNHTYDHSLTLYQQSKEAILAELLKTDAALDALGIGSAKKHFAYPYGYFSDNFLAALHEGGYLTARTASGLNSTSSANAQPPADMHLIKTANGGYGATSLTQFKTMIDLTIKQGGMCSGLWHIISPMGETTSMYARIADFQAIVDYVYSKVRANLIDVVTISEWYEGLESTRQAAINRTAVNPVAITYTDALLKEDGDHLLLETGDKILTGTV